MGAVLGHFEPCPLLRCWPCFDPFSFRRCQRGVCAAKTDDVTAWGDPTESCRHQNRSPTRRATRARFGGCRAGPWLRLCEALHLTAQRLADSKRTELGTHSLRGCVEVPIYVPLALWFSSGEPLSSSVLMLNCRVEPRGVVPNSPSSRCA